MLTYFEQKVLPSLYKLEETVGIRKKVEVKYEESNTQTIVSKADYYDGYEISFYEPTDDQTAPF
jgi:hypothetical protein